MHFLLQTRTSIVLHISEKPKAGCKEGTLSRLHSAGGLGARGMGTGSRETRWRGTEGSTDSSLRNSVERRRLIGSNWGEESEQERTSFKGGRNKGTVVGECMLVNREQNSPTPQGSSRRAGLMSWDGQGALVGAWRARPSDRTEAEYTGTDTDQWTRKCQGRAEGEVVSYCLRTR